VIGLVLVVLALVDTADVNVDDHGQSGKSQVVARSSWGSAKT
jgi:hypothetical protein